jgi:hypothetical protein
VFKRLCYAYTEKTDGIRWRFMVSDMKALLRRIVAITAAYAVALHGLLALSVIAAHIPGVTDGPGFALCASAGLGAGDDGGLPGKDQAHCLQLCLAAANAAGCDPDDRGCLTAVVSVQASLSMVSADWALPPAAPTTGANRPRAPPA